MWRVALTFVKKSYFLGHTFHTVWVVALVYRAREDFLRIGYSEVRKGSEIRLKLAYDIFHVLPKSQDFRFMGSLA